MADDYGTKLITDLPDQFKGKPRIEALMMAIGRQLDELKEFYDDLNVNRALSTAEGVQLDMIGSIVGLTRAEAGELIAIEGISIEDDVYRSLLGYKIMLNTSTATYYDIVHGIRDYYNIYPISYSEDPSEPARIRMKFPDMDFDAADPLVKSILKIKPAGVAMLYCIAYYTEIALTALEQASSTQMSITMEFPFWRACFLNGLWLLDGTVRLDGTFMPMETSLNMKGYEIDIGGSETAEAYLETIKDAWYLDGTYALDGTKILDATREQEVL